MTDGDNVVYVGMDFNVGKMAAVINLIRGGLPYAVDTSSTQASQSELDSLKNEMACTAYSSYSPRPAI